MSDYMSNKVVDLMGALKESLNLNQPPELPDDVAKLTDLPISEDDAKVLDALCLAFRDAQAKFKEAEESKKSLKAEIAPLAESLNLPRRVLGPGWDLRRTSRTDRRVNESKLKMKLISMGYDLDAVRDLVESVVDESVSVVLSVYELKQSKQQS